MLELVGECHMHLPLPLLLLLAGPAIPGHLLAIALLPPIRTVHDSAYVNCLSLALNALFYAAIAYGLYRLLTLRRSATSAQ